MLQEAMLKVLLKEAFGLSLLWEMTHEKGAVLGTTFKDTICKRANGDCPEKLNFLCWLIVIFLLKYEIIHRNSLLRVVQSNHPLLQGQG